MRINRMVRNEFLKTALVVAVGALLFMPDVAHAISVTGTVRQITTNGGSQFDPSISGNIIVYTDLRNGSADIYYYDLSLNQEFAVTNNTLTDEQLNDVSGNTIVYTRYDALTGLGSVRAFVVGGADSPVAANPTFDQSNPGIGGTIVAWEDHRAGQADIWAMDLSTGEVKQITDTPVRESDPAVNNGRIAYQRVNTDGTCQIFVTDFATLATDQITTAAGCHGNQDINGDTVVYDGIRSGERDIFVSDLVTGHETRLALAGVQRNPNVSGDWVVFEDLSTGTSTIMLYHVPTGSFFTVATGGANNYLNDIDGNRVVYTSDVNGAANLDTYLFEFTATTPDTTPPTISLTCPAEVNLNAAAYASVTVTDSESGVASQSAPNGNNALDTSTVGTKTFTVTATDNEGSTGSNSCSYQVVYDFEGAGGFGPPIANPPVVNTAKAGSTVPVKWQLPDGQGGFIGDLGAVVSMTFQQVQCSDLSSAVTNEVPTATSGSSGLRYDAAANQFIYNWKTASSMAGKCYVFILRLNDGSAHYANFSLK